MKLVIAIIQPHKLEDVKQELYKAEVHLLTVNEVLGHGRQKGYRPAPRKRFDIVFKTKKLQNQPKTL